MRRHHFPLILVLAALASTLLPACSSKLDQRHEVLAAIHRTAQQSAKMVYEDTRADRAFRVTGLIEDDFRFKARVALGGAPGYDEVVSDDTLAVRFFDPTQVSAFVNRDAVAKANPATDLPGIKVTDALLARRWVVDPAAAPVLTESGRSQVDLGKDPVLDAITALDYVETAVNEAASVKKWSKDDIEPAYLHDEDHFIEPGSGSGVERYDLVRPPLPAAGAIGVGGQVATPKTSTFRKMAIYIKGGYVVKVAEDVSVEGKSLDRLVTYFRGFLKDQKVPEKAKASFDALVKHTPKSKLGDILINAGNAFVVSAGSQPILLRKMKLDLLDIGKPNTVALPQEGVIHGSLAILISAGTKTVAPKASGGSGSGTSAGTGTTGGTDTTGGSTGTGTTGTGTGSGDAGTTPTTSSGSASGSITG